MKKISAWVIILCVLLSAVPAWAASDAAQQSYSTEKFKNEKIFKVSEKTGTWAESTSIVNHDGKAHLWSSTAGSALTFAVKNVAEGNYEVYYWVCPHVNNQPTLDLAVHHNGKTSVGSVYQKTDEGESVDPGWVLMGVYDFAAKGDQKVTYTVPGGQNVRGTAIKLVPTDKEITAKPYEAPAEIQVVQSEAAKQEYHTGKMKDEKIFEISKKEGDWQTSASVAGYDGGPHYWSNKAGIRLEFAVKDVTAGNYELYYWVCPHMSSTPRLDFKVHHNGKISNAFVYEKLLAGENVAPGWVSLGVYDFSEKGEQMLVYESLKVMEASARASAIKLVPTDKEVTASQAPSEPVKPPVSQEIPTIGDKKPNTESALKDITVAPAGKCVWNGNWAFSGTVLGPMTQAPNSLWIAGVGEEATVTYNPQIEAVGDINIFVYLLYWHENQNPNVKYEVHHNGKVDTVMLDPTTLTQSSWVYLGIFDFAGDIENEYVQLVAQPSENEKHNTRASTIMFEIVNEQTGGIWQTKYVSPHATNEALLQSANLAELNQFDDMKDHWAHYDVEYMANEKLVQGVAEGKFDPEANITRAEYVTILDRAMGYELVQEASYPDLEGHWAADYVAAAKKNGLLEGLPTDDGFKPDQPITREEMALFTYNAIKATKKNDSWVKDMQTNFANYTDTAEISDYAKTALEYLIQTGIIKGTSDTTVSPKDNATRAQGAVILKRFMQLFVWAGPPVDQEWTLMFQDNFDGDTLDWSIWRSEKSAPGHILSYRGPENVEVKDGSLYLNVKKEIPPKEGMNWSAASVWVRPEVFSQTYGYWEARYKYTAAPGINNSFWTYVPQSHNIHKNPDITTHFELDINEGHYPNKINTNYHTWVTGERKQNSEQFRSSYDLSADYHTYAMEWTPEKIIYYHDGKIIREQENLNAHQLQFPYLSAAVISWAGAVTDELDGTAQIFDYVRIWQRTEDVKNTELNYKGDPLQGKEPWQ